MNIAETLHLKKRKYDITLIGEIVVDEIYNRSTGDIMAVFGGSPANISMNMFDLGFKKNRYFGAIGDDLYGSQLLKDMKRKGINTKDIKMSDHSTSIVRINKTELTPIPSFYRSADSDIEYTNKLEEAIVNSAILHFTYWPLSKEPSKTTVLHAIKAARANGTLIGFDPNYHDALVSRDSIKLDELPEIMRHVDIMKPSLDDSIRLFGEGLSPEEYLRKYIDLGVKLVVMTLGKDGLIAHYAGQFYTLDSMATKIVDATGAGDAFFSGLYAGILKGETIENALKIGSACSAYSLRNIGAVSNLPKVESLKQEFRIGEHI